MTNVTGLNDLKAFERIFFSVVDMKYALNSLCATSVVKRQSTQDPMTDKNERNAGNRQTQRMHERAGDM